MEDRQNKIAIYRAVFANYDTILDELVVVPNADYFLFTDDPDLRIYPYKTICIERNSDKPSITNRIFKLTIPDVLNTYAVTIYLDGNIGIYGDIEELIDEFLLSDAEIGLFSHPNHNDIEDELELCLANRKSSEEILRSELKFYSELDAPKLEKFSDNSILFRKQPSKNLSNAMSEWLYLVTKFSGRDQISLPYIRSKYNLDEYFFDFSPRTSNNQYFIVLPHNLSQEASSYLNIFRYTFKFILKKIFRYYLYLKKLYLV